MSNRSKKHPYLSTTKWLDGSLCFWRTPNAGSIMGYNVSAYENILSEWKARERKLSVFDGEFK